LLALLGSAERAFYLAERIQTERRSVPREVMADDTAQPAAPGPLGLSPGVA
jgi:hypothetical protein